MDMPKIIDCTMSNCAYNRNSQCHALAITVGSPCAMCDTYVQSSHKGGVAETGGGVGACKMEDCRMNVDLECTAKGVHMKPHGSHPDCASFTPR